MGFTSRMQFGTRQSFSSASLTGTYQALGNPISHAASILKIVNGGTTDIDVSIDGSTNHDVVPASGFVLYDVSSDNPVSNPVFIPNNTQVYVKGTAGTGTIYLVHLYVEQSGQ